MGSRCSSTFDRCLEYPTLFLTLASKVTGHFASFDCTAGGGGPGVDTTTSRVFNLPLPYLTDTFPSSLTTLRLPVRCRQDDFMPYASDPWAYWSGYYTSRPAQKGYIRKSNNFLQVGLVISRRRLVSRG